MENAKKTEGALSLTAPIAIGLFPIGVAFGLLGYQQHLSLWSTVAFSVCVYAGSAQFVALGLLAEGITAPLEIFFTVWLVNLRHLVLSLAYLPSTKKWTFRQKIRLFPFLTDETFAVLIAAPPETKTDPSKAWMVTILAYGNWCTATLVGYLFGRLFPDPKIIGLDFALASLFIGIIVLFVKKLEHVVTLGAALLLTFLFHVVLDWGRASIIIAVVLASLVGSVLEWKKTSR